jgi:hypothetical protein
MPSLYIYDRSMYIYHCCLGHYHVAFFLFRFVLWRRILKICPCCLCQHDAGFFRYYFNLSSILLIFWLKIYWIRKDIFHLSNSVFCDQCFRHRRVKQFLLMNKVYALDRKCAFKWFIITWMNDTVFNCRQMASFHRNDWYVSNGSFVCMWITRMLCFATWYSGRVVWRDDECWVSVKKLMSSSKILFILSFLYERKEPTAELDLFCQYCAMCSIKENNQF